MVATSAADLSVRPASLGRSFLDRVAATPDKEAFRSRVDGRWESMTWSQCRDRAFALAAGLMDLGLQPEDRVAIASGTRIEWILADFAVLCAGAATTTVYPSTAADEVTFILTDSRSRVLFAEDAGQIAKVAAADLPELRAIVVFDPVTDGAPETTHLQGLPILTLAELADRGRALLERTPDAVTDRIAGLTPESLATLIYTSGTTGRPKGVRLVHDNWTYEGKAVAALGILGEQDVQYLWLPLSHVLGKMLIAMQMEVGFATVVDGDLSRIVDNLKDVQPTWMGGAPRIFEKVRARVTLTAQGGGGLKAKIFDRAFAVGIRASRLRQQRSPVPVALKVQLALADRLVFARIRALLGGRIRFFVSGSAKLSADVAEWFDAAGLTILEGYGLTETSAACSVNLPGDTRIGTVGPALPGSEFAIAEDGEILVRGGGIMRGYAGLDEETAGVLGDGGWFRTGDIGELDADGFLSVTDRKKDLIKTSGGKYISPQKIEVLFKALNPYASQIVVHGEGRKYATALITLDHEAISEWGEQHGLAAKALDELAGDDGVQKLISGYVDELNAKLERWETIKRFKILTEDLSEDAGELTPSAKVRRKVVERNHGAELDELYPKD